MIRQLLGTNEYLPYLSCSAILAHLEQATRLLEYCGEVSEWLKELAWKASIREIVSRVRISPSPPDSILNPCIARVFLCLKFLVSTSADTLIRVTTPLLRFSKITSQLQPFRTLPQPLPAQLIIQHHPARLTPELWPLSNTQQ